MYYIPVLSYISLKPLKTIECTMCCTIERVTHISARVGAVDALVKAWEVRSMRLLATIRNHTAEIVDLQVNQENTLLASASLDKTIRVWCLASDARWSLSSGTTRTSRRSHSRRSCAATRAGSPPPAATSPSASGNFSCRANANASAKSNATPSQRLSPTPRPSTSSASSSLSTQTPTLKP